jgi:hypothetical protein
VGFDAGDQLSGAERLGHVVVAADLETEHAVDLVGAGREKQDRRARQRRRPANLAAQLEAIHLGKHHVEQDEVGFQPLERFQSPLGAAEHPRFKAVPGQIVVDQRGKFRLVFHNGDSLRHGAERVTVSLL